MDNAKEDLRKFREAEGLLSNGKVKESESLLRSLIQSPYVGQQAQSVLEMLRESHGETAATEDRLKLREAEGLFKSGKLKESESLLRSLIQSPDVGPQAQSVLGLLYLDQGQTAAAKELFDSVIKAGHQVAEAYYGLGVISEASEPSYARAQYEYALRVNPKHRGALARLNGLKSSSMRSAKTVSPRGFDKAVASQPRLDKSAAQTLRQKFPAVRSGIVSNLRFRTERQGQMQVIEFVLERPEGLEPVSVFMQGRHLTGIIKDGHEIVLTRNVRPKPREVVRTNRVYNKSVGAYVDTAGKALNEVNWGGVVFFALIVIIGVAIVMGGLGK